MSNYKSYEYGQVPKDWDIVTLGGHKEGKQILLELRNGYTGQQQQKGRYKVSRIETISGNNIDESKVQYVTDVSESILSKYLIKKGDILFTHINSDIHLGKTGLAQKDYDDLLHGMNLLLIRTNPDVVEPEYLDFVFKFFRQQGVFIRICSRAVNQSSINQAKIKGLEFPLPSKRERENIVYILSTLQKTIQKQEEIINTTTALKKSLLNKLFTEGTKEEPLKQTEIGTIPESWELKKLGELCDVSSGGTPSREVGEYWTGGTIPWVKTGEINYTLIKETSEKITEIGLKNSSAKMFPAGTLLMAMYGQGITRGRVAILGIDAALNQACAAIIPFSEKEVSSKYLYRYFEYQYEYIREFGHGANQKNLSGTIIKSIPVAFPKDENEQEIIFTSIDAVQNKLQHHKRKKEVYEHLFKTLLNELMTGAIRVNDVQFNIKNSSDLISVQQSTKTVTA